MSTGNWLNQDGMYIQYGTSKAIPEAGGDFLVYGDNREIEVLINLGATSYGSASGQNVQNPALPSSFQGTVASQTATANTGIVSFTTKFPLQQVAPVTVAGTDGVLKINNPQLYIDSIELETLVTAAAGTGSATGLTGIGLVLANQATTPSSWVQVTPNTGVQLMGAVTNAQMTVGKRFTFYPDGTAIGTGTPPVAGSWLGNVPLFTNAGVIPTPVDGYISAICSGGTFTGSGGGGLIKLRIKYYYYGTITY
jgi:hypothetical protein